MYSYNLKDKVVLLTGASKGIGKDLAYTLAKEGAKVVACARNIDTLIDICNDITSLGFFAYPMKLDLQDEESIVQVVKKTKELYGQIDILINNAGLLALSEVSKMSTKVFDDIMSINVRGVFLMCREVLDSMIASKSGRIINIGSMAGRRGYPEQSAYCASKHALVGFTKSLALEVKKHNIRVSIVSPGGVLTDMSKDLRETRGEAGDNPNWMTVEEVCNGVMYLLSQNGAAFTDELVLRRFESEPWR